jgi:hypothetical protein
MRTKTRLTALALAVAALTTATAFAGTASANGLIEKLPPGAFKGTTALKPLPASGIIAKLPPGELGTIIGKEPPSGQTSGTGGIISKLPPGTLCKVGSPCGPKLGSPPQPCPLTTDGCSGPPRPLPTPVGGGGDHGDHDGHHDGYGYFDGHGYRYGYYHERPEIVVEGAPVAVAVPAQAAVAAPQAVAQAPCNCLTKQNLPDGSVLFQDICMKESALAPAQATRGR